MPPLERHNVGKTAWLRAAVLGANDGILSTASLVLGVAAANPSSRSAVLIAGIAGLIAGAGSMAVGEYVSVSSQKDAEEVDLAMERRELIEDPDGELAELAGIYMDRGLSRHLALEVAKELTAEDALGAHARDELGITEITAARPLQAAVSSFLAFAVGAIIPIVSVAVPSSSWRAPVTVAVTIVALAALGATGAILGSASWKRAALRVSGGGVVAMALSSGIGHLLGTTVG